MPDIKIKGYEAEHIYRDVPKIWLADPNQDIGEPAEADPVVLIPYTYGEAVSKIVEPDFSQSEMTVEISEGELVTELTIKRPANLIPENIANNINIAGVIGCFEGNEGGGGAALIDWVNEYSDTVDNHAYLGLECFRSVKFTAATSISTNSFYKCSNLCIADFHVLDSINGSAFVDARNLHTLIIRTSTVCTITSSAANGLFGVKLGTIIDNRGPIALGTGYIYVPAALVDAYKADAGWNRFEAQFRAIEDYPDICG